MSNTKINDGGPAFPVVRMPLDPDTILNRPGMTLRDWFAGQALVGIIACPEGGIDWDAETTAKNAYKQADAMLAARKEKV